MKLINPPTMQVLHQNEDVVITFRQDVECTEGSIKLNIDVNMYNINNLNTNEVQGHLGNDFIAKYVQVNKYFLFFMKGVEELFIRLKDINDYLNQSGTANTVFQRFAKKAYCSNYDKLIFAAHIQLLKSLVNNELEK